MKPNHSNSIFRSLFQRRREAVANDDTQREGAVSNAAEEPFDGTDDGWMKIAPYGTYPGSRPGRPQNFTEVEANAMVGEFRSLRGKLGRMFRGAPVYIGHPDKDPAVYTDHRRLGKVTDLQVRPDGLYGEVEWNALGLENKREGYWVYPSPRWDAPAGRPEFRPDRLISVGLTNMPRIAASEPVTNSLDFETETETATTTETTIMDRKLLTDKLGLDVTATDEEILAKIATLMSEAADGKAKLVTAATEKEATENSLTVTQGRVTTLQGELAQLREEAANTRIAAAVETGRITLAESVEWRAKLTGDQREAAENALTALVPKLNTTPLDLAHSRVEIGNAAERRETVSNAVDANMAKGMNYDDAWAASKKDPALKQVWEAMQTDG